LWTATAASFAGRVDQAEDLASALVEPVLQVVDSVLGLDFQVSRVGAGHCLGGEAVDLVVVIHV